jgi:magnesium chelatase family protein
MNPCPCGYVTAPTHPCTCSRYTILKYTKKISGPLLDRMDLCIPVPRVETDKLLEKQNSESSEALLKRVCLARNIQRKRFHTYSFFTNAEMGPKQVELFCALTTEGRHLMKMAMEKLFLSARGYTRVLKIARTIADLAQSKIILPEHLCEALTYRPGLEIFTK